MAGKAVFYFEFVTLDQSVGLLKINWTGDATDGSVPSYSTDELFAVGDGGYFSTSGTGKSLTEFLRGCYGLVARTQPGTSPAPTSYGISMNDSLGLDFLNGVVTGRSTSQSERVNIQTNDPLASGLTFAFSTQNTTPSATGILEVKLLFAGNHWLGAPAIS